VDAEPVIEGLPSGRRWWPAVAVLVVAVTAVVFVLVAPQDGPAVAGLTRAPSTALSPSGDELTAGAPGPRTAEAGPLGSLVTHEGDAVTATGMVVKPSGRPPAICTTLPTAALATVLRPGAEQDAPACSPLSVALDVGVESLPGWTEQDGVGFTDSAVTVNGVWRDGKLVVASATAGAVTPWPEPGDAWRVPCAPPAGGWAAGDAAGADAALLDTFETALAAELAAHPDRYHANWYDYPDGDPFGPGAPMGDFGRALPEHVVMVVSTVQEPSVVREHLATLYPGNLCVTRVDNSRADLDAVVQRLEVPDGSWIVDAHSLYAAVANSVFLELPVLDAAAAARIGDDAALLQVRPLVRTSS